MKLRNAGKLTRIKWTVLKAIDEKRKVLTVSENHVQLKIGNEKMFLNQKYPVKNPVNNDQVSIKQIES